MQRILLLGVEDYQFTGKDGSPVQVRRITYTDGRQQSDNRSRGAIPMTVGATTEALGTVREVPGVYEAILNPVQRGKNVTLEAQALSLVNPVDLTAVLVAKN